MSSADNAQNELDSPADAGGLTSGGQYLCASCLTFLGCLLVIVIAYVAKGSVPFDFGGCVILGAISVVSLFCACIGLLAKPTGREWLFALPTLGPILPLAMTGVCVYVFFFAQ